MDLQNDFLMHDLIDYGKKFDKTNNVIISVDRYIVAAIDTLNGESGIAMPNADDMYFRMILDQIFDDHDKGYAGTRAAFVKHIQETPGKFSTFMFYKGVKIAQDEAIAAGKKELRASYLLDHFAKNPQGLLEEYVSKITYCSPFADQDDTPDANALLTDEELGWIDEDEFDVEYNKRSLSEITCGVKNYYDKLSSEIFGQEHAVSEFISGLFRSELICETDPERRTPRATFLFAGPPGVGKTYLAETAAKLLGLPFIRFDMSEYCDKESSLEFIGSDAVYRNSNSGNFTKYVEKHPKSVILLDEIEKAHVSIIHLFLQILDAGRIRDSKTDKEVSLKDTILIFTTNAGKQLYENSESENLSALSRKVILNALEKDVDPRTKIPFFPSAICSRFATGNVVMFNHLSAETLWKIAKKQTQKNVEGFAERFGILVDVDEDVYTSLIFSEGGTVDGRTIKARAGAFFHSELFELFRLMESSKNRKNIHHLKRIRIAADLSGADEEIKKLYYSSNDKKLLVFASEQTATVCAKCLPDDSIISVQDIEAAEAALKSKPVRGVLIDLMYGAEGRQTYLNYEDEHSPARDFLNRTLKYHGDLPVYLLTGSMSGISYEERLSFYNKGVSDIIILSGDTDSFRSRLSGIPDRLHKRESIRQLSRANKLIRFETAQSVSDDGTAAEIKLFDFKTDVAVDAEDTENILSSISKPDVTFDQIIGAEDAKSELKYFVEYLNNPGKYIETGVGVPRGVLLYGPPGTGKTMLAKAVAAASDVTFLSTEGNQFLSSSVDGAKKIHDMFRTARKYAPSIIFVDEFDTIARSRAGAVPGNEKVLTALLSEMDGFKKDDSRPVFVLAATNYDVGSRGEKSLDSAVLRRFDRRIYVDLPNREERKRFLEMKFAENAAFELSEEKINNIAVRSTGMSLADLASVIELALRTAIRKGENKITEKLFDESFEEFNSGEKKHWDDSLLLRVARHEAGHALLCRYGGETPSYLTITARSSHGGYLQHDGKEDRPLSTRDELIARLRTSLAGRAAEIVCYGENDGISTGAAGDLEAATNLAYLMICRYGMSEKFGLAVIGTQAATESGLTADIYEEINRILSGELRNTIAIIEANRDRLDALVNELIAKNHLTGDEIKAVLDKPAL